MHTLMLRNDASPIHLCEREGESGIGGYVRDLKFEG